MKVKHYVVMMETGKNYDIYTIGTKEAEILAQARAINNGDKYDVISVIERR